MHTTVLWRCLWLCSVFRKCCKHGYSLYAMYYCKKNNLIRNFLSRCHGSSHVRARTRASRLGGWGPPSHFGRRSVSQFFFRIFLFPKVGTSVNVVSRDLWSPLVFNVTIGTYSFCPAHIIQIISLCFVINFKYVIFLMPLETEFLRLDWECYE